MTWLDDRSVDVFGNDPVLVSQLKTALPESLLKSSAVHPLLIKNEHFRARRSRMPRNLCGT